MTFEKKNQQQLLELLLLFFLDNDLSCERYQVNFWVLLYDAHVFLGVVAVPAVSLPIVIHTELNLMVFIRGEACTRELRSNFPGPLWGAETRTSRQDEVIKVKF